MVSRRTVARIPGRTLRVGVISDTHGLLRPEALAALRDSAVVLHAGDVGKPEVLDGLRRVATSVVAVRGNVDRAAWAHDLPERVELELAGRRVLLLHDLKQLGPEGARGWDVVVSGHSHRPRIERRDGVLYLNPGSAGPRRFRLPIAVAGLDFRDDAVTADIVELPA